MRVLREAEAVARAAWERLGMTPFRGGEGVGGLVQAWQRQGWLPRWNPWTLCAGGAAAAAACWALGYRRASVRILEALMYGCAGVLWERMTGGTLDIRFAARHAWLPAWWLLLRRPGQSSGQTS